MVVKKEDLLTDLHTMHLNEIWKLRQKKTWQTHLCYTWQYIAGYNYIIISFQDSKLIYYGIESKIMFKFGEKDLNIFLLFFVLPSEFIHSGFLLSNRTCQNPLFTNVEGLRGLQVDIYVEVWRGWFIHLILTEGSNLNPALTSFSKPFIHLCNFLPRCKWVPDNCLGN